jgi:hypothetical protein
MNPTARSLLAFLFALPGCERSGHSRLPDTPLFVGVEGADYSQGTRLIEDRLTARFPSGSSVRELRDYLRKEGLQVEPAAPSSTPNSGVASVKYGGAVCGSQVRVSWEGDAAGKVRSIEALYSDTGCP